MIWNKDWQLSDIQKSEFDIMVDEKMSEAETALIKSMILRGGYSAMEEGRFNATTAAVEKLHRLAQEDGDSLGLTIKEYVTPGKAKAIRERLIAKNAELRKKIAYYKKLEEET